MSKDLIVQTSKLMGMKVFIPVVDGQLNRYQIADGFSSSGSVCVYDTDENEVVWYQSAQEPVGQSTILEELRTSGVVHVITSSMAPMALKVFSDCGFTVFRSIGRDLMANIEFLKMACLPIYGLGDAFGATSGCKSTCSSCPSTVCKN
jgi:predicted Fe-Mo cluster-binding NifX family protein